MNIQFDPEQMKKIQESVRQSMSDLLDQMAFGYPVFDDREISYEDYLKAIQDKPEAPEQKKLSDETSKP